MFIGRESELNKLERLYSAKNFEFLIMYGRRRIGKTEILKEFSKKHPCIFFSGEESDNNLVRFTKAILNYFDIKDDIAIPSWESAFSFIANHISKEGKTVLIIDEFPYIAKGEPKVKSILQNAIDREFKDKDILLILCGSSVSFMVNDMMGRKTPLYGRNTSVLEVLPFTYDRVKDFFPSYSKEDQMKVYGIVGGVPYYLSKFKEEVSLERNIANEICDNSSSLNEEPITLLKSELREVNVYNDILNAIACGATRLTEIADKAHIELTKMPSYLNTLKEMRIIEKIVCCGEKENSKKTQYRIVDHFFSFWYRFIFGHKTEIEMYDDPIEYVESIRSDFDISMGAVFEVICRQFLIREARLKKLPFIPQELGKWWGSNPILKTPDDIDILGIRDDQYLFCECKFRNMFLDIKEFQNLIDLASSFKKAKHKYYYFFVKSGYDKNVTEEAKKYQCSLIRMEDM